MYKEVGTKLVDANNQQVYPYTKVECVEGLDRILDGAVVAPEDAVTNSVPITDASGNVDWVELQAGNISVKVSNEVFTSNDLETVLVSISNEITKLKEAVENGLPPGGGDTPSAGFVPVLVDKLPETGKVGVIYRVPVEGTSTSENKYTEYYWVGDRFEKFGDREPGGADWGGQGDESTYEWLD